MMYMMMEADITSAGQLFGGGWQGCPGSNAEQHFSSNTLSQALYTAGVGFTLFDGSLTRPQAFCDDFMAPIGGVGVSPREAEDMARSMCKDILLPWTQESDQFFKLKKCGCMAVHVDEYGFMHVLDPDIQFLTEHGLVRIPVHPLNETVKALGVCRGLVEETRAAANEQASMDRVLQRIKVFTHTSLPLRGRKLLIESSAMGGGRMARREHSH
jgi:hypothetical protein